MTGDCGKLEVTDEELTAEVGIELEELMVGRKDVCSFVVSLPRRDIDESYGGCECIAIVDCCESEDIGVSVGDGGEGVNEDIFVDFVSAVESN